MEVFKTRRNNQQTGGPGGSAVVPTQLLKNIVEEIVTDKVVSCTGIMAFSRQIELPSTIVSYSHTIPGQPTGSITETTMTFWPIRIPATTCGANVYLWYGDANTIYYYTEAQTVFGLTTIRLNMPRFDYTGNNMFIYNGNGAWRMYITGSGTLTTADEAVVDIWALGGGGAGGGNGAAANGNKWHGRGGGGGGERQYWETAITKFIPGYEYEADIGAGGARVNTTSTGGNGGNTYIYCHFHGANYDDGEFDIAQISGYGGSGGKPPTSGQPLVAGAGGDGGSGGGGGGAKAKDGGAGGKNGADGSSGQGGSTNDNGQTLNGGAGGNGLGQSGYAFGDSTFDGLRRGDGGHGGGGMNSTHTVVSGNANSGTGGSGANGYATTNTTAYYSGNGGSGIIILRSAS